MITTIQSERIESAIISDKQDIVENINNGLFDLAKTRIDQSAPLWMILGYSYKTKELLARLAEEMAIRAEMAIV